MQWSPDNLHEMSNAVKKDNKKIFKLSSAESLTKCGKLKKECMHVLLEQDPGSYRWNNVTLRNHAYSNTLKISPSKTESFQIKILILFPISAQNIDCGYLLEPPRRGGSNEYHNLSFWAEIRKRNVYPCKTQFYYVCMFFVIMLINADAKAMTLYLCKYDIVSTLCGKWQPTPERFIILSFLCAKE